MALTSYSVDDAGVALLARSAGFTIARTWTDPVRLFAVEAGDVTVEMRSKAKMVNYGIVYGLSAFGLADRLLLLATSEDPDFLSRAPIEVEQLLHADVVEAARGHREPRARVDSSHRWNGISWCAFGAAADR